MVALSAVLDAPEQTHGCVHPEVVIEGHVVEVLDGDPAEYGAGLLDVGAAAADQLAHQVRERLLVLLRHRDGDLIDVGELDGVVVDLELAEGGRGRDRGDAGVGGQLLHVAPVLAALQVQRLRHHVLAALLVDQLQHLMALLLHQRGRCGPENTGFL